MSDSGLLTFSLFSAMALAVAYPRILARLSLGLATPYEKADVTKRFIAAVVDMMVVATALVPYRISESPVYLYLGAAYLLLRDTVAGRSVGKFLCGLVVIDLKTGRPCGWRSSIGRNVLWVLPGANIVAVFLEARTVIRDPQGQRLGDRFALTQVVEGFGAKDVVAAFQEWWLEFAARLDPDLRKPGRAPVRVPR